MTKQKPENHVENRDDKGQYLPGVSGNPKGRPPSGQALSDAIRNVMDTDPDVKKDLIDKVISMAKAGDMRAITLIWNYLDGMPKQRVDWKDVTDEESEELLLLREILTKHERTRKPLPAKQQTN